MPTAPTLIYLIGFAGSGKLTIGRELAARTGALLVDNHHTNNIVLRLVEAVSGTPLPRAVWDNIAKVRAVVFETLEHHTPPGRSLVLTNELLEGDPRAHQVMDQVVALAQARGSRLLVVRLSISSEELVRRVASPERAALYKTTHAARAEEKVRNRQVLKPQGLDCLELDITALSASEAAAAIERCLSKA